MTLMQGRPANSVRSPPPCGEGLGVGVYVGARVSYKNNDPPPQPSPTRGREQTECVASVCAPISPRFARSRDLVNSAAQRRLLALAGGGALASACRPLAVFQNDMPDR